jgi:hypothetical protein
MPWQVAILISIMVGYILQPILNKKVSGLSSRTRNLLWVYFFAAVLATLIALLFGGKFGGTSFYLVFIVGIANAIGCYCYWRAIDINLSKTSLLNQMDDIIAMALGYIILSEGQFLNYALIFGIILSMIAVFVFSYARSAKTTKGGNIIVWIAIHSLISGIACFSMRYFHLTGVSILSFVAAWYEGSFLGAYLVFILSGKKERGKEQLSFKKILKLVPLSAVFLSSLLIAYWIRTLTPIIISQPIWQVSEIIFPTIIGLWIFKEIKGLSFAEKVAMLAAATGGVIIMISF